MMLFDKVNKALDRVKPMLEADGGSIELVSCDDELGKVIVRLKGACHGCPMAALTLKQGVERIIKEEVKEVKVVEAVE